MRGQEVQAGTAAADRASREAIAEAGRTTTERGQDLTAGTRRTNQEAAILRAQIAQLNQDLKLEDRPAIIEKRKLEIKALERQLAEPSAGLVSGLKISENIKAYKDDKERGKVFADAYNLEVGISGSSTYYTWEGTGITGLDKEWVPKQLPTIDGKQVTLGEVRAAMEKYNLSFEGVIAELRKRK